VPNILGPLIGAAVEKKKGKSPIKGALLGSLAQTAARAATSVAATFLAGYVLKKLFDKTAAAPASDAKH
jgi:hypothetical protein